MKRWDVISVLLDVIHSAAAAGPKYASIAAQADAELWAMMKEENEDPPLYHEPVEQPPEDQSTTEDTIRRI